MRGQPWSNDNNNKQLRAPPSQRGESVSPSINTNPWMRVTTDLLVSGVGGECGRDLQGLSFGGGHDIHTQSGAQQGGALRQAGSEAGADLGWGPRGSQEEPTCCSVYMGV